MMSPYEGERIFEAEMVRLHQCDRNFYACTQQDTPEAGAQRSLRQWLAQIVGLNPPKQQPVTDAAADLKL